MATTKDPRGEMKADPTPIGARMQDSVDKDFDLSYTKNRMDAEKAAARASANRKEAEAEGQKYAKGGMTMAAFEKSPMDKDKKTPGWEGSAADKALDKKQLAAVNAKRGYKAGGMVRRGYGKARGA